MLFGCTGEIRETTTARTSTEMLLLSTAIDRSIKQLDLLEFSGKKVFIDDTYFESVDKSYLISSFREYVSSSFMSIVPKSDSDYIIELRNAGLGTFESNFAVGLPNMPLVGGGEVDAPPVEIPEVNLFKRISSQGWCKFKIWIYDNNTGMYVFKSSSLWGNSYYNQWVIFGIGPFDIENDIYPY